MNDFNPLIWNYYVLLLLVHSHPQRPQSSQILQGHCDCEKCPITYSAVWLLVANGLCRRTFLYLAHCFVHPPLPFTISSRTSLLCRALHASISPNSSLQIRLAAFSSCLTTQLAHPPTMTVVGRPHHKVPSYPLQTAAYFMTMGTRTSSRGRLSSARTRMTACASPEQPRILL
ncbi:hypothetical protein K491DRAFT_218970 [Lophiostoma macrostomum CBS 122681]|uniref:Uncharacterized protein n=1 Tax=Lophiostoma macrostomum CBS 122681 TaxID=1314788 RepID=A0A6A6SMJ6_9PLEO|nr:hypothetical protein K491DRAFT_218970 [Lophiostoma macrostomum CBS 122681]